jgi:hypothetical protein
MSVELERARDQGDEKGQRKGQARVDRARSRLDKAEKRLSDALRKNKTPKVEVGSLEEVIQSMERDVQGEWADVMFVPPGAISAQQQQQQQQGGGKGGNGAGAA